MIKLRVLTEAECRSTFIGVTIDNAVLRYTTPSGSRSMLIVSALGRSMLELEGLEEDDFYSWELTPILTTSTEILENLGLYDKYKQLTERSN